MGPRIDIQVPFGIIHAVGVTDFAGEIENYVDMFEQRANPLRVSDVTLNEANVLGDSGNVLDVTPASRNTCIDNRDVCAKLNQLQRQVATYESEAPRNENPTA